MPVAKNHIRLTEPKLIRWSKQDMALLKKLAKAKKLTVTSLVRMAVGEYLTKESEKQQ